MQPRERKIFYTRFLFFNVLLLVFVVATFPGKTPPVDYFTWTDKFFHALTFFMLAGLMCFAQFKTKYWLDFVLLFGFGLLIELVQRFIPLRSFDLFDAVANAIGLVCFYSLAFIYKWYKRS